MHQKYILNACLGPDIVRVSGNIAVNKTDKVPALVELLLL